MSGFGEFDEPFPQPAIQDYDPRGGAWEQHWDDTGLHDLWKGGKSLPETFFYESAEKTPAPIDHSFAEAALTAASGLALMIPEVGPVLFAAGVGGVFFLQQGDKEMPGAQHVASKIEVLEKDLFQRLKEARLHDYKAILDVLKDTIEFSVQNKIFEKTSKDDLVVVHEKYDILKKHAFGADSSSIQVMLDKLESDFHWADNDIQQTIVALIPFMVQCMELKLVLNANLARIHQDRGDNEDEAHKAVNRLEEWMKKKQEDRMKQLSTEIKQETLKEGIFSTVREAWKFKDTGSGRVFQVSGVQKEIYDVCYMDDVERKMKVYMGEMANWYKDRLQEHVDRHFDVMKQTMERWKKVADALDNFWGQHEGHQDKVLDGVKMFHQMQSRQAATK
ncbi:hypothetical protein LEL_00310 [Akanthomyces lecanii RCEF 1005]|uniref:Uncharacterized protein n=1 Tax=Akanthomyces lecanii RCEF 1005 TaxID=1081108 RepID=A0A168JR44_CORDF|nr:hypothetical protein LEL_00310 [Akanthomyces lecanii RCEF 1005]